MKSWSYWQFLSPERKAAFAPSPRRRHWSGGPIGTRRVEKPEGRIQLSFSFLLL